MTWKKPVQNEFVVLHKKTSFSAFPTAQELQEAHN
jgi:hypothetical protein